MSAPEEPAFAANAPPLEQWSVDMVCEGLTRLGLDSLVPSFRDNAVSGRDLLTLTDEDYEVSLKCTRLQVRKIKHALEKIQGAQTGGGAAPGEEAPTTAVDDMEMTPSAPVYLPEDATVSAPAPAAAEPTPTPAPAQPAPAPAAAAAAEPYGIPPPLQAQPAGAAPPYAAPPAMPYGGPPPAGYPGQNQPPYGQMPYGAPPPMMPPPQQVPYGYGAPQMQPYALAGPPVYVPFGAPPPNVYGAPPPGYSNNSNQDCSIQ